MNHQLSGERETANKFAGATLQISPFPSVQIPRSKRGNVRITYRLQRFARINIVFVFFAFLSAAMPGPLVRPDATPLARVCISTPVPDDLTCTLPAPDSFDGERTSATTAFLEWSPVSGAAAYRLWVYDKNTLELVGETTEYGTSKNLTGLEPNVSYRCVLASMCPGGATSDYIIITDVLD